MAERLDIRSRLRSGGGCALILGFGRSGRPAFERLREHGFRCRVAERNPARPDDAALAGLDRWVRDDDVSALDGVDLVIKSPGIPRGHALVRSAIGRGIPVVAELELGWAVSVAPLYSITGSNGKSTTTALLAHVLSTAGVSARAAGNIGDALSAVGPTIPASGAIAVEVSSFQIEDLDAYRSRTALVLNVTPDHLDRHGSLQDYLAIKLRLLDLIEAGGYRILSADDPTLRDAITSWRSRDPGRVLVFGRQRDGRGAFLDGDRIMIDLDGARPVVRIDELTLTGPHNLGNVMAATLAAATHGLAPGAIAEGLRTFAPLRHRMEPVAEFGGVLFINDSKATNLDALRMALLSFPAKTIVLIAGGRDKGSPFEELADLVAARVQHLVLIGESADRIADAWSGVPRHRASSMEEAVRVAHSLAASPGVVLLAPGCASFDMFTDFNDRGDRFCRAVRSLLPGGDQ